MRALGFSLIVWLSIVDVASSQVTDVHSAQSATLPTVRPVLLGTGPNSLINRIDTQDLIQKGQKDAAVMFSCSVKKTGEIAASGTYRGTPDSKLLEQEVLKKISPASDTKFIPAIYNRQPVDAIYYGTVTLAVVSGKPRLRIFSNQETEELKKEADFIGPQPFFGGESGFTGFHYPKGNPVQVNGVVELALKVDATGNLQRLEVRGEEPPFLQFGEAAAQDFSRAKFIPAFREGKPVACDVTLPVFYREKGF